MTTGIALRSILVTPNLRGADGVSALSREIVRALPTPSLVLSLHDTEESGEGQSKESKESKESKQSSQEGTVRVANGHRARFLAEVARAALRSSSITNIVCSHLHLAPAAALLAWRGGPTTIVLCGIEAWVPLRTLERWALERGTLVAISQHTADRFKEANPAFVSTHVAVCHPGLPALVRPSTDGSRPAGPTALIVARMSAAERYKGHDALLDIWPGVLARHPDARLLVAGDGDDRRRLESRAASLGLARAVTFVGRVSDAELSELYARCRVFVMPSRDEGFGLVFLEAMRAGTPCIGGRGAAAEIIEHGVTGLIVDPDSRDDLAAAVLGLFDDPAIGCRFGSAGRERFLSTFTDDHFQRRFLQALARRQPAPGAPVGPVEPVAR